MNYHQRVKLHCHLLLAACAWASGLHSVSARDADLGWGPTITTSANIYMSSNGNDNNDGSINAPVKSFGHARDLANTAKAGSTNGVTIWLRAGWYTQNTTFTFNSTDGGSAGQPVIWRAYPNESVVITGAREIDSTKWSNYSGPTSRLNAAVTSANVQQCNLSDLNLAVTGAMPDLIADTNNGFIQYTNLPGLYWNGPRQALAKYPKSGFMEVETVDNAGSNTVSPVITYKTSVSQLYVSTNSLGHETNWVGAISHGAWLKGYWRVAWNITTAQILAIDTNAHTITMSPFGTVGNKYGHGHEPYGIINLLEEISAPGDWCVDTQDAKVYFYAPGAITNSNLRISDNVNSIFNVNGASYLEFIGLEINDNRGNAFNISNGNYVQINGCSIHDIDEDAVLITGGTNCGVASSNLYNLGAEGVFLKAAGTSTSNCGHYVNNCHIYNFGILNNIYAGAVNAGAGAQQNPNYGSSVTKNLIHDSPHLGVDFGGSNTLFQANDVFRISKLTGDIGTFYSYISENTFGGNTFQYNFSHNSPAGDGIYYDNYGLGDIVNCNVAYQMNRGFIYHQPYQNITCTNNLPYDNASGWANIYPAAPGAHIVDNAAVSNTTQYDVVGGTLDPSNKSYTTDVQFNDPANLEFSLQSSSPIFTDIPGFVNFPSGSRLDVSGGGTGNYTQIDIMTDGNATYQRWNPVLQSDGYFSLAPENAPGSRLDDRGGGTGNGNMIQLYTSNNQTNQRWAFIQPDGTFATSVQDGMVYVLSPECATASCLDVVSSGFADHTIVQLHTMTGGSNQKWQAQKQTDGSFELIPQCASGPGIYSDSYRIGLPTRSSINYSVNPPASGAQF